VINQRDKKEGERWYDTRVTNILSSMQRGNTRSLLHYSIFRAITKMSNWFSEYFKVIITLVWHFSHWSFWWEKAFRISSMNDLSFVHEICKSGLWKWSPSENLTEIMEFFRRSCIFLWLISNNKISESYRIIIFNMYSQKNGFCHLYQYLLHFRSRSPPHSDSVDCVSIIILFYSHIPSNTQANLNLWRRTNISFLHKKEDARRRKWRYLLYQHFAVFIA